MESFHYSDIKQTTSGPPVVAATPTVLAIGVGIYYFIYNKIVITIIIIGCF